MRRLLPPGGPRRRRLRAFRALGGGRALRARKKVEGRDQAVPDHPLVILAARAHDLAWPFVGREEIVDIVRAVE